MPPVCKFIIIANIVVFVLQIFFTRSMRDDEIDTFYPWVEETLADEPPERRIAYREMIRAEQKISVVHEWCQLETKKVLRGQVWRVLTCAFCHDRNGVWHILFNMLFLYWFGVTLEAMYGSREFLWFYLTAAIISSLAYIGLDLVTGRNVPAIGASGAVMAVTMLYAIFYPRHIIYVFFVIPLQVRWLVLIYVVYDLHPVLLALSGDQQSTGVAHSAHLGGLAFGYLYWKFNLRLSRWFGGISLPRFDRTVGSRRGIKIHRPSVDDDRDALDERVDAILRKMQKEGEESLTSEEREVLMTASRRYKNRPK